MATRLRPRLTTRLIQLLTCALIGASLGACSGGGAGGSGSSAAAGTACAAGGAAGDCGKVLIAATDAEGDFASYIVDVQSVTLKRSDGTTVETLPDTTRIDFAELTDLSALLGTASLAPGEYVGGTIRLDYSNADVEVQQGSGTVQANVVDGSGNKLGAVDLDLRFADNGHLVVRRHATSLLSLDFNLAASNSVDTSVSPPNVVSQPYISASIVPATDKALRVRGALQSADVDNNSYDVQIRPWHRMHGDHGIVTVHTTDMTEFDVDSKQYTGTNGLAAVAALPQGTLTVAVGSLNLTDHSFTADTVYAGDSVGGVGSDTVYGHVVARSGDRLTVKAGLAVHRDGDAQFARTVIVNVGTDTAVSRNGAPSAMLDAGDISVGQRIAAFGQFSATAAVTAGSTAPSNVMLLDATSGRVRLLSTRVDGTVNSVVPGQIDMKLHDIDHLGVDLFDFSGTGASADTDADPTHYQIGTATLALNGLAAGQAASALGFVTRFGTAPPDFDGRSVIEPGALPALLSLSWGTNGTSAPFVALQSSGLVPDLSNPDLGDQHFLLHGFTKTDLTSLPAAPTISGRTGNWSGYGIVSSGHIELFSDFASFIDALQQRLGANERVQSLTAFGIYDNSANTFTAGHIVVRTVAAGG